MTTPYAIKVAPTAERQINQLPDKPKNLLFKLLEALAINPRPPGAKKIEGLMGLYTESLNGLRIVYKIEEQEIWLLLIKS